MSTRSSDARLLGRVAARDEEAAATFFDRYAQEIFGFLVRRSDDETARDLLQEVFSRALRAASSYRGDSSARTWLYAIARNVLFERARNRIDARPLWSSIEGLELGPESLLIEAERRQQVVSALAQLPDEQAIVLELHRIDGLPHKEIARLLGISVAASRKRLERAALSLQTAIREPMPEVLPHTHIESWRHSLLRRALPERDSQ